MELPGPPERRLRVETPEVRELILGSLMLATGGEPNPAGIWKVFLEPTLLERFDITIAMFRDPDGYLLEVGQRH